MPLPTFTGVDVLAWNPFCDGCKFLPLDWSGDSLDCLNYVDDNVDDIYRLWVAARRTYILDADLRSWIDDMIALAISKSTKPVQFHFNEYVTRLYFLSGNGYADAVLRIVAF